MYIGIDIGGTKCAVLYADENGKIISKSSFETVGCTETLERIFEEVALLGEADAIGISCGGPLDTASGIIMSPPNLIEWDGIHITQMLQDRFGIKAFLQNDANACAVAEWKFGAGRGCDSMIFLTFGTGMGAGLILNGRLYEGANGNAGEVGHMRIAESGPVGYGKSGSFEGFCSGGGIKRLGQAKALELFAEGKTPSFCTDPSLLDKISAKTIAECASRGFEDAAEIYKTSGRHLGKGLSLLVDILNPQLIVIGSIYERSSHLLADTMNAVMNEECLRQSLDACRVVPSMLGDEIGDYAAISVAMLESEKK